MDENLTDRDRLVFAFDDLKLLGLRVLSIGADTPEDAVCCYVHALQSLDKQGWDGATGMIFWTLPRDVYAFSEEDPGSSHFFCEHSERAPDARPEVGNYLNRPLALYWYGPVLVIVETLREWGLRVSVPNCDTVSIEVRSMVVPAHRDTTVGTSVETNEQQMFADAADMAVRSAS